MRGSDDWAGVREPLPGRPPKPRDRGLTMVIDKGMPTAVMSDWLSLCGPYVDIVKLGFGTGLLYGSTDLDAKLHMLRDAGVLVCPGGTLVEIAWHQGRASRFIARLAERGFTALEVSDGTVALPLEARLSLIRAGNDYGLRVLSEVGKKNPLQAPGADTMRAIALRSLEAGAWKVIVEARDSGRGIGIFDDEGVLKDDVLAEIGRGIPGERLLWEAPQPRQQVALLKRLGGDVNLGNVDAGDVLSLEASRRGLRSDTWAQRLELESVEAGAVQDPAAAEPVRVGDVAGELEVGAGR